MKRLLFIGVFIIAACISSWVTIYQHQDGQPSLKCSLDGTQIQPRYEVIIIEKDKSSRRFSCVLSAQIWLRENSERVSSILVTDEVTGKKIKVNQAYYVVSKVITTPYTGNRTHVFSQKSAAELHARQFKGKLVKNSFEAPEKKPVVLVKCGTNSPNSPDFLFPPAQNPLSLPTKTALMREHNCCFLSQKYIPGSLEGYFSLPEHPPQTIV